MPDIARRSLLVGFSAAPAAIVAATLPSAVLARPEAPLVHADVDLIAEAARVMRLARLKDRAADRLGRREEAMMDTQPPKPEKPTWPNPCVMQEHAIDPEGAIERSFTMTFNKPSPFQAESERTYAEAVAAWEIENARLHQVHGVEQAEDLNDGLLDKLTAAAATLATMPATSAAGLAAKARAYLNLTEARGWSGEWVDALAVGLARDAVRIKACGHSPVWGKVGVLKLSRRRERWIEHL